MKQIGVKSELVDNGGQEGNKSVVFEMMFECCAGNEEVIGRENHSGGFEVVT